MPRKQGGARQTVIGKDVRNKNRNQQQQIRRASQKKAREQDAEGAVAELEALHGCAGVVSSSQPDPAGGMSRSASPSASALDLGGSAAMDEASPAASDSEQAPTFPVSGSISRRSSSSSCSSSEHFPHAVLSRGFDSLDVAGDDAVREEGESFGSQGGDVHGTFPSRVAFDDADQEGGSSTDLDDFGDVPGSLEFMQEGGVWDSTLQVYVLPPPDDVDPEHSSCVRFCSPSRLPTAYDSDMESEGVDVTWDRSCGRTVFPTLQQIQCQDGAVCVWSCSCTAEMACRFSVVDGALSSAEGWDEVSDDVCPHVDYIRECVKLAWRTHSELEDSAMTSSALDQWLLRVRSTAPLIVSTETDCLLRRLFEFVGPAGDGKRYFWVDGWAYGARPGGLLVWSRWGGANKVSSLNPEP